MRTSQIVVVLVAVVSAFLTGRYLLPTADSSPPTEAGLQTSGGEAPDSGSDNSPGTGRKASERAARHTPSADANDQAPVVAARGELDRERARANALKDDNTLLKARVAELEARHAAPTSPASATGAGAQHKLSVAFGTWRDSKDLRDVEWKPMAEAANEMHAAWVELQRQKREGKPESAALKEKVGTKNRALVTGIVSFYGKLPTYADNTVNGAFTHPIWQSNLLASQLEAAGTPLTTDQHEQLARLGEEYEQAWNTLSAGKTDESWALELMLGELELKERFTKGLLALLTPEQRPLAEDPEAGRLLFSPMLMLAGHTTPLIATGRAELEAKLNGWIAEMLDTSEGSLLPYARRIGQWMTEIDPWIHAASTDKTDLSVEAALALGHAQVRAMKELVAFMAVEAAPLKKVRDSRMLLAPNIEKSE